MTSSTSARPAKRSVDYPEFGAKLARAIASGEAERGIAVCGSGIGISIAVNRNPACRCARVDDPLSARLSREHNDANVPRAWRAADRRRHGARLRHRFPRHRLRRRAPPAPRRRAFHPSCRIPTDGHRRRPAAVRRPARRLLHPNAGRCRPGGRQGDRRRTQPRADPDRADRIGEHRRRARCSRRRDRC